MSSMSSCNVVTFMIVLLLSLFSFVGRDDVIMRVCFDETGAKFEKK